MQSLFGTLTPTTGFFATEIWQNTLGEYTLALGVLIVVGLVLKLIVVSILARLKTLSERTSNDIDDTLIAVIGTIKSPFYVFLGLFVGIRVLTLPEGVTTIFDIALLILIVYQAIVALQVLLEYGLSKALTGADPSNKNAIRFLSNIVKVVLWVIGGLVILQNVGFNVGSLLAGLGIGGIAIALAVQNILSDLFSSFSIIFDKPFVVGDVIKVGNTTGTVEHIGIKTTRLRSLHGEEIIVANQELTSAQIQNFKRITERRVTLTFGVTYDTPNTKLTAIPGIIEKIVSRIDGARFDRAYFVNFGDSALEFEATYYSESPEYDDMLTVQEKVNLGLKKTFEKESIEMAYPTQTLFVRK